MTVHVPQLWAWPIALWVSTQFDFVDCNVNLVWFLLLGLDPGMAGVDCRRSRIWIVGQNPDRITLLSIPAEISPQLNLLGLS
jgi:hypothetical protein